MNTLRIDTNAIASLFSEPEMKVELQRCVVAEIVRRMMPKDIDSLQLEIIRREISGTKDALLKDVGRENKCYDTIIRQIVDDRVKELRNSFWSGSVSTAKQSELKKAIEEKVATLSTDSVNAAVGTINQAIEKRVSAILERLDLPGRVEKVVDAAVEAEIKARVKERLAALAGQLAA